MTARSRTLEVMQGRCFRNVQRISAALLLMLFSFLSALRAQDKPLMEISRDCQTFAISSQGKIVCASPRVKRVKKIVIQRADVWVAEPNGKEKLIVDSEKFMPVANPESYIVNTLSWSPDGSRIAMSMTTEKPSSEEDSASPTKSVALLDDDGHEIKIEGSKTRFLENAANAAWLPDNANVVYLMGAGPYKIGRASTVTGQSSMLFEGHPFEAVVWDAKRNLAFAVGRNLTPSGRESIVQLDLLHETLTEVSRADTYQGVRAFRPPARRSPSSKMATRLKCTTWRVPRRSHSAFAWAWVFSMEPG